MIRPPPRSTLTDTLFPYTTLFRSPAPPLSAAHLPRRDIFLHRNERAGIGIGPGERSHPRRTHRVGLATQWPEDMERSEERRVGTECVSTCRSWSSPYH